MEEISSITQTLQSREFGDITMTINAFVAWHPSHNLPHSTPSAPRSSRLRRSLHGTSGSPLLCSPKNILTMTTPLGDVIPLIKLQLLLEVCLSMKKINIKNAVYRHVIGIGKIAQLNSKYQNWDFSRSAHCLYVKRAPRRIVNCLIAPPRNILTYLLTYLLTYHN